MDKVTFDIQGLDKLYSKFKKLDENHDGKFPHPVP
jgi:hypothetical protein